MWNFTDFNERLAIIDDRGNRVTYKELDDFGKVFAAHISERSLIFSLCSNTIGSIVGYTACINHHKVSLLLNEGLNQDLLKQLITTYRPSYIWAPDSFKEVFATDSIDYEAHGYVLINLNELDPYTLHEDLALLLTTSGSTGSPKLVKQTYVNIACNAEQIVEYLEIDEKERPITTLPMNYTYGLSIMNSHFMVGATLLLTDKTLFDKGFWSFFEEAKATSFGGVPYTYEMLKRLKFLKKDYPSLNYYTQAGGKLSKALHQEFANYAKDHGKRFYIMYGATEATARMAYLPYNKSVEKCGSIGIPIPRGHFEIVDEEGHVLTGVDEVGELVYYGDNVTMGYATEGADLCIGDVQKGKYYTGDMVLRDHEDYYYVVGRKKRFIKLFGNRVSLDEAESLIKSQFDIECACKGQDDLMDIYIVEDDYAGQVRAFMADKLRMNPRAFNMHQLDEIPKNESGKVDYKRI